jgi:hypothetical protein
MRDSREGCVGGVVRDRRGGFVVRIDERGGLLVRERERVCVCCARGAILENGLRKIWA